MNIWDNFFTEIQWTESYARTQVNEDEESYDEDSCSELDWAIGESRQEIEIDDWSEVPDNYEPVSEYEREEYYRYKEESEDEDY